MNLSNFSQIRFNGKDISVAKLNGNVLYEEPRRGVTLTLIFDDPSTGEEIHREIIEYPKGTEVNTYDICSTISIEGYKHGMCDGGTYLTMDEDKELTITCFEKENLMSFICTSCGNVFTSDRPSPCPMCGGYDIMIKR